MRLMRCLAIPADFQLDNGSWVNGQEGLLITLHFLAYPSRLVDKEDMFGWELSRLSRINNYVKRHIYIHHRHLLENHWNWHIPHLLASKEAWQRKKVSLHPQQPLNMRTRNVCQAFDGFRVNVCRPQPVTVENGGGVALDLQAEVYSGHTKVHNFLFLTVCNAFGIITFLDGPHLGAGTDRTAFRDSGIRQKFEAAMGAAQVDGAELAAVGDKIFVDRLPSFMALRTHPNGQEAAYEAVESQLRTSIENVHSRVVENWKGLRMKSNMKVGLGHVAIDVKVAFILTNALTLLQGSQVHVYFSDNTNFPASLNMPSIESYFEI